MQKNYSPNCDGIAMMEILLIGNIYQHRLLIIYLIMSILHFNQKMAFGLTAFDPENARIQT